MMRFLERIWKKPHVGQVTNQVIIEAPVEKVWREISSFNWQPFVDETIGLQFIVQGKGKGAKRTLLVGSMLKIKEVITFFDEKERTFTYKLLGSFLETKRMTNTIKVISKGIDQSLVVFHCQFQPSKDIFKAEITGMLDWMVKKILVGLKKHVE